MRRILVTGALGQIGSELVPALRERYGAELVVASNLPIVPSQLSTQGVYEHRDCTLLQQILEVVRRHDIGVIYHLAALLSAVAEEKPHAAWSVNMGGLYNVLETHVSIVATVFPKLDRRLRSLDAARTYAAGDYPAADHDVRHHQGCGRIAVRLLRQPLQRHARGLRLPGLISYVAPPGSGTTDYAVEIFYQALRYRHYTCFLAADTRLDLMYMPDAIRAMNQLMEADAARLRYRNAYNVTAMSITPAELAAEIRKHVHGFAIDFQVDPVRQCIADSWPRSLDASAAWEDWGFAPQFDLASMTTDMLARLSAKIKAQKAGG